MFKKLTFTLLSFIFLVSLLCCPQNIFAKDTIILDFFYGIGCPHCGHEEEFLQKLKDKYQDQIQINQYEIYYNDDNATLFKEKLQEHNIEVGGVPLLFIDDDYVLGFANENITGVEIENKIKALLGTEENPSSHKPLYLNIFSRQIDLKAISLPLATILIAFVDGFNPCALWILIFLITMLINMKDRKKLYILGSVFIIVSGLVYFVFLAAWFNFFKFIGYAYWIKVLIGIIAIISGIIHIKDGLFSKGECKVTSAQQRQNIITRMKNVLNEKNFFLAIVGISALAISVNLIEVVCSAGLPAIYTNLLSTIKLSTFQYYSYLSLYILIFMLDDLAIFFIAIKTFEVTGITNKYSKFSSIFGGFLILIIGIILIFKPELLMFG
jgi:glutaredoxin